MLHKDDRAIRQDDMTTEEGAVAKETWRGNDSWAAMHGMELIDFVEGCERQTSLEKQLVIQETTDAIYRSTQLGRVVRIN